MSESEGEDGRRGELGEIKVEDNCQCGRMGKFFLIHGRIQQSELKGCSDTIS